MALCNNLGSDVALWHQTPGHSEHGDHPLCLSLTFCKKFRGAVVRTEKQWVDFW